MMKTEYLRKLIDEVSTLDETYQVKRWQLSVKSYLQNTYKREVHEKFSELQNTNNVFDDASAQEGYLEAFYQLQVTGREASSDAVSMPSDFHSLIKTIVQGNPKAIQPLKKRRKGLQPIQFNNEYDYQDYVLSALIPWFKDIRPEEYTPSHAGTSKRVDIYLKNHNTFIEIKYARDNAHAKKLGDEIAIDIIHYQSHPGCQNLIVIIFDPNRHVANSDGLIGDFTKVYQSNERELAVELYVSS